MIFHIVTIFPDFFRGPFEHGVIQRAQRDGIVEIRIHDLRNWTHEPNQQNDSMWSKEMAKINLKF